MAEIIPLVTNREVTKFLHYLKANIYAISSSCITQQHQPCGKVSEKGKLHGNNHHHCKNLETYIDLFLSIYSQYL